MQNSTVLRGMNGFEGNATQKAILLANIVKETIEGIITPGQIYAFSAHALSDKFQLDDIDVVVDTSIESSELDGKTLKLNINLETPGSNDYLNILEGVGRVLSPNTRFRHELQTGGLNWANSYGNELYKAFLQPDQKESLLGSIAGSLFTLISATSPLTVDQYSQRDTDFVSDFVAAGKDAENLYLAIRHGIFAVLFDDDTANKFGDIYYSLRYGSEEGRNTTSPASAEFMSAYIFECIGAI